MSRIRFKYWYSSWCSTLIAAPFSFEDFESPLAEQTSIFVVDGTVSEIFALLRFSERISHLLVVQKKDQVYLEGKCAGPLILYLGATFIICRKISPDRINFLYLFLQQYWLLIDLSIISCLVS